MQAIIIAAGESSRCWPLNHQHKSQIKIFGKPLIYWTIKGITEKGIKDIVLILGPNSVLKDDLTVFEDLDINISKIIQEQPLGTGNAINRAKDLIREPFFVFHPYKIIAGEVVGKILEKYHSEGSRAIFVGKETNTPWDYGILKHEAGKVVKIVENPKPGDEPSNIKTLGAYFLEPDFFDYYNALKEHHPEDYVDALNDYIKAKGASFILWGKEVPALKYPWELLNLLKIRFSLFNFKKHTSDEASIGKNVLISGNVYIADNATIGDGTKITGPCFIGESCRIGQNNIIQGPTSLEKEVITGSSTKIKNSIIGQGTHLGSSGCFSSSIIGENCRFGLGFITKNSRPDKKTIESLVKGKTIDTDLAYFGCVIGNNTRFGIKSGTMPGVFIGSNCIVGSGFIVSENLKDDSSR